MKKIRIKYSFIIFISLSVAFTPFELLLPMLSAICVHEAGHLAIMRLAGANVRVITLGVGGVDISSSMQTLDYKRSAAVYLGGCLFNAIAAILTHGMLDSFSFCCIAYALINIVPIMPLDGAMALSSLLCTKMLPEKAACVTNLFSVAFLIPIWMFCLYLFFFGATNFTPLVMSVFLFMTVFSKEGGG